MEADEHAAAPVALAEGLVNALTPGHAGGLDHAAPPPEERAAVVAAVLQDRPNRARTWVDAGSEEHGAVMALAGALREVFEAAAAGEDDRAAGLVNALLAHGDVRPVLSDHDGQPWHLHAHWPDAAPAAALRATCALGLGEVIASGGLGRLGVCAADACDRVFHDGSRNASRRYHSAACQARTKTAAFRARRSS